jgi:peptidoglycan/LPS O-acetylase OafA/YrhL
MGKPDTIDALTGLRFIAAFSVLVGHAAAWLMAFDPTVTFVHYFTRGPAIGMPLFFVLSGFVIHYNYGESFRSRFASPLADFFIARFARLYPLYLFLLLAYMIQHGILRQLVDGANPSDFFLTRYLLLWQAWNIEYRGTVWSGHVMLPPAWSISVEVFFYALYPCLALFALRLSNVRITVTLFLFVSIAFYVFIWFAYVYFDALRIWGNEFFLINADPQNALLGWLMNTGPVGRMWEFLMGVLVAQAYLLLRDRPATKIETILASMVLTSTVVLTLGLYVLSVHNSFLSYAGSYPGGLAPLLAVIIFCCARYRTQISRILGSGSLVKLGDASYSIYLLHEFTLPIFRQAGTYASNPSHIMLWLAVMAIGVTFTLALSFGSYYAVEVPARRFLRTALGRIKATVFVAHGRNVGPPWLTPAVGMFCILFAFGWWNAPLSRGPIVVVEATYGSTCSNTSVPAPWVNTFKIGNWTQDVKRACRGKKDCLYSVDLSRLKDPVNGCPKDLYIKYQCQGDGIVRIASVEAEAFGKEVTLKCDNQ